MTMSGPDVHHTLWCLIVSLALISGKSCAMIKSSASPSIKGVYWPSWADSTFPPSAIDTTLFTHVYYAFLIPNNVTFRFHVGAAAAAQLRRFTSTLRTKTPPVKTLFSIGGGGADPKAFARMASGAQSRKAFVDSSIRVARAFGFDGMDLDWESPQSPKEMDDFGFLLADWRAAVELEASGSNRPQLLLTAAAYFSPDFFLGPVHRAYPVAAINANLDWINAMCYDYHGSWDTSATGEHAALFDPKTNISTSYGLGSWIRAGLVRSKLVMGLALYGRTWKLRDPRSHGVGAPAVGVGPGGGTLRFDEIRAFNRENNATVVHDAATASVYSVAGTSWIGYDDPASVSVKVKYGRATLNLGGYFFWAANGDSQWMISKQAKQSWDESNFIEV